MRGYRIDFIRHGLTEANTSGRFIGSTDLPLSDEGVSGLYKLLENYDYPYAERVYCSPLQRARQTAQLLYPNTETEILDDLREASLGEFENRGLDELMKSDAFLKYLENAVDNPPPGGESLNEVMIRCYSAINRIVGDMMREGLTHVAVVSHNGIILNTIASFGLPKLKRGQLDIGFGEGVEVLVAADMWQRSGCFEIAGKIPLERIDDEE